jgi:RNA polymerase sigma factor (sigma-70 family)
MANDNQLLREYAETSSEAAFAELVKRHVNMVYSAALRGTGDAHLAEELTQLVFVELSRKASNLVHHPVLAGWLYTCVRLNALNARRSGEDRNRRQREYHMAQLLSESPESTWQQLRPVLDDTLHELGETDRAAIVLRFFENLSLQQVGTQLGLSENAARMRVDRALGKLKSRLSKRGITSSTTALAAAMLLGTVVTAPSALAASIAVTVVRLGPPTSTGTGLHLLKPAVTAKKLVIIGTAGFVALGVILTTATFWFHPSLLLRLHNWLMR